MKVDLKKIVLDPNIYPRSGVSQYNVSRLVAALKTGSKLPPVTIEASSNRLVDGWHRHAAFIEEGVERIECVAKTYSTEADLFADAVRLNIGHGEPLDSYSIRNAIIRLESYGFKRAQISEVVRVPADRIEKIERGFATGPAGEPVALKGGLEHLHGSQLTEAQQSVNRHYSGGKATFHLRQLCSLLESDMHPRSESFEHEMRRLINLWTKICETASAA
jgi:hypothetical protein